jgi:hypothetical protein
MTRTTNLITFSLLLSLGCGGAEVELPDGESNLPGDIDHAPADGDGKADVWDWVNDPARLANRLNYRLDMLPREGKLDKPVWAGRGAPAGGHAPRARSDTKMPPPER